MVRGQCRQHSRHGYFQTPIVKSERCIKRSSNVFENNIMHFKAISRIGQIKIVLGLKVGDLMLCKAAASTHMVHVYIPIDEFCRNNTDLQLLDAHCQAVCESLCYDFMTDLVIPVRSLSSTIIGCIEVSN